MNSVHESIATATELWTAFMGALPRQRSYEQRSWERCHGNGAQDERPGLQKIIFGLRFSIL